MKLISYNGLFIGPNISEIDPNKKNEQKKNPTKNKQKPTTTNDKIKLTMSK